MNSHRFRPTTVGRMSFSTRLVSMLGSKMPHLIFDAIQLPNLGNKPKRFDEGFLQCFVEASASMRETPIPLQGRILPFQSRIDLVGIGLNRSPKSLQSLPRYLLSAAARKLQDHILP